MKTLFTILITILVSAAFAQETKAPIDTAKAKIQFIQILKDNNRPILKDVTYNIDPIIVNVHKDGTKEETTITTITITENLNKRQVYEYSDELFYNWIKQQEEIKKQKK